MSSSDGATTAFGFPVHGEIIPGGRRSIEQKPLDELTPLFPALLDYEDIEAIRWEQYTPYFNDGEPCEFRAGELAVKFTDDDESGDYEDGFVDDYDPRLRGGRRGRYRSGSRELYGPDYQQHGAYDIIQQLNRSFGSGAFDQALVETFGDHAQVTVRRDGIEVEFYEHD